MDTGGKTAVSVLELNYMGQDMHYGRLCGYSKESMCTNSSWSGLKEFTIIFTINNTFKRSGTVSGVSTNNLVKMLKESI